MFPINCANCGDEIAKTTEQSAVEAVKDTIYCNTCADTISNSSDPLEEDDEEEEEEEEETEN